MEVKKAYQNLSDMYNEKRREQRYQYCIILWTWIDRLILAEWINDVDDHNDDSILSYVCACLCMYLIFKIIEFIQWNVLSHLNNSCYGSKHCTKNLIVVKLNWSTLVEKDAIVYLV